MLNLLFPLRQRLRQAAGLLTLLILIIAILVLIGWVAGLSSIIRPIPGLVAMNPMSALCFIVYCLAFGAFLAGGERSYLKKISKLLIVIVLLISIGRLTTLFFTALPAVDHWLFPGRLERDIAGNISNSMAVNTAFCFLSASVAILCLWRGANSGKMIVVALAIAIGMLSWASLLGYIFRIPEYLSELSHFPMAIHTAICFLMVSLSLLSVVPDTGVMKDFTSTFVGGVMARRLLPFAFFVPIFLGLVRVYLHWHKLVSVELGIALLVISIISCFIILLWYNARLINRRDQLRQRAESDLAASEERLKLLINGVKEYAIFMLDAEGIIVSWNEGAEAIKGYHAAEIIGRHMSVFYTSEDSGKGEPQYNLMMARLYGRYAREGWRIRKDGSRFWADIVFTAIYDQDQKLKGFAKITRDTTEQKMAREQIAYQARLMEDVSDAVFSTDAEFIILSWNKAAEALYGYRAEEVSGLSSITLFRSPMGEDIRAQIRDEIMTQGYWKGELVHLNKFDQELTILFSISVTRDDEGRPGGYVMVGRDITERKKMEEKLLRFNQQLENQVLEKTEEIMQSNSELRLLASHLTNVREEERAAISREIHDELGQQLTGLKMDLSWIGRHLTTPVDDPLWQKLSETKDLIDSTIRTVRRLATELRPRIIDDLGLIEAIDWLSQEFTRRSGIRTSFKANLAEADIAVWLHIGLFRICQESLTNVGRHSGAEKVEITLERDASSIWLSVEDNGRGMPRDEEGRHRGSLGLLGMKERAMMMGGRLAISDGELGGMKLSVTIPLTSTTND